MAQLDWIDYLAGLWAIPYEGNTKRLRTYKVVGKREWPETLDTPCVLTWSENETGIISAGGPSISFYTGISEFHLVDGVDKSKIPFIETFKDKILTIAATNIGLNNPSKIQFYLAEFPTPRITGPLALDYGEEHRHLGLVVNWTVSEDVSGVYSVALTP